MTDNKPRLRRALLLLALSGLLCSFLILTLQLVSSTRFLLTLEISSSASSVAQLFYDLGPGYNEGDSLTVPVTARSPQSFQKLVFVLPSGIISHLRFDPLKIAGTVTVRNIVVSGPTGVVVNISAPQIKSLNQIQSRTQDKDGVTFVTVQSADDPGFLLELTHPLDCRQLTSTYTALFFFNGLLLCWTIYSLTPGFFTNLLVAGDTLLKIQLQHVKTGPAQRLNLRVARLAARISDPAFIVFDAYALWFYALCIACFIVAISANLNSSSISIYKSIYNIGAPEIPIIGSPRPVRVDEWAYETPLILNQTLKMHPFAAGDSYAGTHRVSLIANAPILHFTTLFRPQFWAFFVLPIDYAFAAYWQFKALFLVTGVFTLLLLLTRSSVWSAFGSLWYFFSPFTQWAYSWPSGIPEMAGLVCLTVVFACYLTIGKNPWALLLATIGAAGCAVNCVLCAYAPHLVPLLWFAVFVAVAWSLANVSQIFRQRPIYPRLVAILVALGIVGFVGRTIFSQLRVAIHIISNTAYPGTRRLSGGVLPVQSLISNFFEWTETEKHWPPALGNICDASGFLWLSPITLFVLGRLCLPKLQKYSLACLWALFTFLVIWMVFPVPERYGELFGMSMTWGVRCLPAIGLCNIAIVAICMSSPRKWPATSAHGLFASLYGIFVVVLCLLLVTDKVFAQYFSWTEVGIATAATTLLIALILNDRKMWLGVALVVPQAMLFGSVNPIQQGIGVVTSSELYRFVQTHKEVLNGKWFVFSDSHITSGFLASTGCDVYTGLKYLPDIDHFHLFASVGLPVDAFNRDGLLVALPLAPNQRSSVEVPLPFEVLWRISSADPILKLLGVRYFAFAQKPSDLIESQLVPLTTEPISGLWIYKAK